VGEGREVGGGRRREGHGVARWGWGVFSQLDCFAPGLGEGQDCPSVSLVPEPDGGTRRNLSTSQS
jgi:hypothetical protein